MYFLLKYQHTTMFGESWVFITANNDMFNLVGKVLEEDLMSTSGAVLIPKGTQISPDHVERIMNHQLFAEPKVKCNDLAPIIENAVHQLDDLFEYVRNHNALIIEEVHQTIVPTIMKISEYPYVNELFGLLNYQDHYTPSHCFAVSMISTMFGRWLGLSRKRLIELATASALHDIGKARIPVEVLNKPGKLTEEEFEIVKKHTIFGYELIRCTSGTTQEQALAALQHHEREDGSGYPFGLHARQISYFARIIAIADIFHAMGSKRVYHGPLPTYQILDEMSSGVFGKFDPSMMRLFIQRHMEQLIGTRVKLTGGRVGIIRMIHRHEPSRPLVETEEGYVDLMLDWDIRIEKLLID